MRLKLGENRRSLIKKQFRQSDSASNVDKKWSNNYDDLMRPYRVKAPQGSKKLLILAFL